MDVASTAAPPVVAVVVVHEPGEWFETVLDGLRDQDYPNLRTLFLVAGPPDEIAERVHRLLPSAHVRHLDANPGYGAAADEALRLVEGSGLFCFLHDDVALDPDAITRLVEELYRSNAGIVGPKLVDWDDPEVLQSVGLGADRFGELDSVVEPEEVDQEQHDAVRDVFVLPSACLLTRADLFRALGGFDPQIDFHGDSLDLCWRAHLGGARVLVVPAARARHRGKLTERRPDLAHKRIDARHRIRTVATLTGRWRTLVVLFQLAIVSLIEVVVGLFTGRAKDGLASLYALGWLVPSLPGVLRRRRQIRPLREVPDREVAGLQVRGSARLVGFLRLRELARRSRQHPSLPVADRVDRTPILVGTILVILFLLGSRGLVRGSIPQFGQFVGVPHPGAGWRSFLSSWRTAGFGADSPAPPVLALVAFGGSVLLGKAALLRTVLILAPVLLGYLGMWRALVFVPSVRARLGAVLVYAAVPLPYTALAAGRWGVVATYGALPWAFSLLRAAGGLTVAGGAQWGDDGIADTVSTVSTRQLLRIVAALGLLGAVVGSVSPTFPALVVATAVVLAVGTLLAGGSRSALTSVVVAVVALALAFVLLEPWSFSMLRSGVWNELVGAPLAGPRGLGVMKLAAFRIGPSTITSLALVLYVPVIAAPLVGRGWRLTWAARSGALVAAFLALAALDDRGSFPIRLPEPGLLLAPVALGLAISAGCALAGFERDIRGARFGWRQPLGLIVSLALVVGLFQGIVATANGRWSAPRLGLPTYLSQLPAASALRADGTPNGNYRVVFVGDPRVVPAPAHPLVDGVAFSVTADGSDTVSDLFGVPVGQGEVLTAEALRAIAGETTDRVGRLLAPLAVRYLVVPIDDGVRGGAAGQIVPPAGLLDALTRQLDLRRIDSPSALAIFENVAWLPVSSLLDPTASASSREAGADNLATHTLGSGAPVFVDGDLGRGVSASLPAGTLHLAVPADPRWEVLVDGRPVTLRPAFGWSLAADLAAPGTVSVRHRGGSRGILLLVEALLVAVAAAVATGVRVPRPRRRSLALSGLGEPMADLPLIDLGSDGLPDELPLFAARPADRDRDEPEAVSTPDVADAATFDDLGDAAAAVDTVGAADATDEDDPFAPFHVDPAESGGPDGPVGVDESFDADEPWAEDDR